MNTQEPGMSPAFARFLAGYTAALLWSSTGMLENGEIVNLDDYPISTQAEERCRADCLDFWTANESDIHAAARDGYVGSTVADGYGLAGRDFALTRNRHGAGYWDGDLPKELGQRLTKAAHAVGENYPYLGDDGQVWVDS